MEKPHPLLSLARFMEHLPKQGDPELSLLKCHLLVEEAITKLISRPFKHPNRLSKARLTFAQKVNLARCVDDMKLHPWIWAAVEKLNAARNALSHGLDGTNIQDKMEAFVAYVEQRAGKPDDKLLSKTFGRFQWAVFKVFAIISVTTDFDPMSPSKARATLLTSNLEDLPKTE